MSEMIERVAKALAEREYCRIFGLDSIPPGLAEHYDAEAVPARIREDARIAIEAMREPTKAMLSAAYRNNHPRDEETWRTMIDVAFAEQVQS